MLSFKDNFFLYYWKRRLKIIKYNKCLQKNLNKNLINYKFLSGKYIIYETKGTGKEYIGKTNRLIFEGEYSNGIRNGKGKEYYYDNTLKFEGEYLNDERNGKGKEYNKIGKLVFEGEYLNEKRYIGKEYDINGNLMYELNHVKGKGKEYDYNDRLIFEGEYLNGERNGKGKEYSIIGKILFEGEYLNDKRNGIGKEYDFNGK